jgi:galactose-1-phosphate uridylyltransferase
MREELSAAKVYLDDHHSNFWDDLAEMEAAADVRYLGKIGRSHWMMSYAPLGVAGDVTAVVEGVRATIELNDNDLMDISQGLLRLMKAYDRIGIYSFNMNFFTGRPDDDFARFHLIFSPRTFFNQALGTPDIGALRNLFNETLCMAYPEEIRGMIKPDFDEGAI